MSNPRRRAALFLNPAAASGRARLGRAAEIIGRDFDLSVHEASGLSGMIEAISGAARDGFDVIVVAGGDGTVNIALNAMADAPAALGILPVGTANDFAQEIGVPADVEAAAARIAAGSPRRIDVIAVNGRRFCTVGGLGLVTECAVRANELKTEGHPLRVLARGIGPAIYPAVAVPRIVLGGRCSWRMRMEWTSPEDLKPNVLEQPVHGVFFANQKGIGGDLVLPADARNDDGLVDICVMATGGRARLLRTVLALRMAWRIPGDVISVHRAARIRVESAEELGFLGDGELLCRGTHFDLQVLPGALKVIV